MPGHPGNWRSFRVPKKAIAIAIGGVGFMMGIFCNIVMQVAPEDAISNTAKWLRPIGVRWHFLQSDNTDRIVRYLAVLIMVISFLWVIWSIFFVGGETSPKKTPLGEFRRTLSASQRTIILNAASTWKEWRFRVFSFGQDHEAADFAREIANVLKEASWTGELYLFREMGQPVDMSAGVTILPSGEDIELASKHIKLLPSGPLHSAFVKAGVAMGQIADLRRNNKAPYPMKNVIEIYVGPHS